MIGLFANEKHAITNEIDVKKIEQIIDKIKYINDNLCHYVIKLYYEYSDIISENNVKDINEELKHKYKNNIIDIKNDIQKIKKCNFSTKTIKKYVKLFPKKGCYGRIKKEIMYP